MADMTEKEAEEFTLQNGGKVNINECSEHGLYKSFSLPVRISRDGQTMMMNTACPKCIAEYEKKEKAIEKQKRDQAVAEWMQKHGIGDRYKHTTLENYKPVTASQKEALNAAKNLVSGFINKLILLGSNGTGKTHLGVGMIRKLDGKILTAYEMYANYRACFSGKRTELDYINELCSYPVLCIDEFGRTKGSDAEYDFLSYVLDRRCSDDKATVILSNCIRKTDCVFFSNDRSYCDRCTRKNCIESKMSHDMISRLSENSEIIVVEGDDYRRNHDERRG